MGFNRKIYRQGEEAAYRQAMKMFAQDVPAADDPQLDNYQQGLNDAEYKGAVLFNTDDLDLTADIVANKFKSGEISAYSKAMKSFNGVVESDPISDHPLYESGIKSGVMAGIEHHNIRQNNIIAYKSGEDAAYAKATHAFNSAVGHNETSTKGFFKNTASSLLISKLIFSKSQFRVKGMYIFNNWLTITLLTKKIYETGNENTWQAFKSFATDISVFVEEVMEDMPEGSTNIAEIPSIMREMIDQWPQLHMIAGGARIGYTDTDETLSNPLNQRYESISVPNRKLEVLADVYSKTPDGDYIYPEQDQRAVEEIKNKIKDIYRILMGMKSEIQARAELYDALLQLRQNLDLIADIFDPRKLDKRDNFPSDLAVVEGIKKDLTIISENRYMDPQIAALVKKINDRIDLDTWVFKFNSNASDMRNPLHKIRRGVNKVILRLNEKRIMEGLRAAYAYYNQIWASIHKGKQLIAPKIT